MVANETVIFNEVPQGLPEPGKTLKKVQQEIDLDASLPAGAVLCKIKVLSLDPYLRGRMREEGTESYVPPFKLGEPIDNFGVGEVLKSENDKFKKGDHLYGTFPFQQYAVVPKEQADSLRILENKEGLPWTTWVGAAGMPGQTAWCALKEIGKPKKGETVFVSGAVGPVGQVTIGLAHLAGAKVIASAGSDEKVQFLKDHFKVEVAFNYKTENTAEVLKKYKKEHGGFHIYVDNVAGPTLEAALEHIEKQGRIVAIGAINICPLSFLPPPCIAFAAFHLHSQSIPDYNGKPYGIKNVFQIVAKELSYKGFLIFFHDISAFYDEIPQKLADGTLPKPKEHVYKGLDNGESFTDLFTGRNFGKAVISLE